MKIVSTKIVNRTSSFVYKGYSRVIDCIVGYEPDVFLKAYIMVNDTIIESEDFLPLIKADFTNSQIATRTFTVGRGCSALFLSSIIYILDNSTAVPKFFKSSQVAGWTNVIYQH